MANENDLKPKIIQGVAQIAEDHFGLHDQGEHWYKGAPWYTAEAQNACWKLAESILTVQPEYATFFSRKSVARLVQDAVSDTVRRGDCANVEAMVEVILTRLGNRDQKKRCYMPISGVETTTDFDLGPFRVQLMDHEATEEAIRLHHEAIGLTLDPKNQNHIEMDRVAREMNKTLRGQTCFVHEADGDPDKIESEAVATSAILFDFLRYSVPADELGRMKKKNIVMGLPVGGRPGSYIHYILPLGRSDASHGRRWVPTGKLAVDDAQLGFMHRIGVFKLAEALSRAQTEFETDLLSAVHWYAESQMQAKPEHEVVNLIVAAGTIIPRQHDGDGVTGAVCEATSLLTATDADERFEIYKFMREAFQYRGEVAHRGLTDEFEGLNRLRHLVQELISGAISQSALCRTADEFRAWIDNQKSGLQKRWQDSQPKGSRRRRGSI